MRIIDKLTPLSFINTENIKIVETDFLIIGTGIAGLEASIEIAKTSNVMLVTKSNLIETNTKYAQGGIAAVLSEEAAEFEMHIDDTMYAGAGLCDQLPVEILVKEGPLRIKDLLDINTKFDRKSDGELSLTKEAAHSTSRILHAGDTTGAEIERALTEEVKKNEKISIHEYIFVIDILEDNSAIAFDIKKKEYLHIQFKGIIIATGSIGQLYENTSNPEVATGDGIALAYRRGVELADLEFIQFHPTTFIKEGAPRFLISESLRGEGGILKNISGERFMGKYDTMLELAPRDVVSRAILTELTETKSKFVYLDMTAIKKEYLYKRFPNITSFCQEYSIDIAKDMIPVSPAAHYIMGGVKTNIDGKTNVENIYAAGEVAMTGVHGANRLASNSLLEGLVFGKRAGELAVKESKNQKRIPLSSKQNIMEKPIISYAKLNEYKQLLKNIMWEKVSIVRDEDGLNHAIKVITDISNEIGNYKFDNESCVAGVEMLNMLTVSFLITTCALERKESRGAHFRKDFPETKEEYRYHSKIIK